MTVAYIVIVILALLPQLAFTVLYWKWIPSWVKNPYGRLAQLDSWSQIVLLVLFMVILISGSYFSPGEKRFIATFSITPWIFLGLLRLTLLKRAVDSASKTEDKE